MRTRIATSFGLALLLALGVIATMLALGTFSASKAEADVDVVVITSSPTRAGSNAQIAITFRHDKTQVAGTGQIVVKFDSLYGFPAAAGTLPKASITLTTGQATGGTSIPAIDPTYTTDAAGDKTVVITIDDTSAAVDRQDMHQQADANANSHVLVFGTAAGITLPVTAALPGAVPNFITVTMAGANAEPAAQGDGLALPLTTAGVPGANGLETRRTLELSSTSGPVGTIVTVTGYGFTNGLSPRVFIDLNDNGVFNAGDTDLQVDAAPVVAGGSFTRTFTVDTVRFTVANNPHQINADDGVGAVSSVNPNDTPAWTLLGAVTTDKPSVRRGETVQIRLRQYPNGPVTVLTIGGAGINVTTGGPSGAALADVGATTANTANYDVVVPTTTPLGVQRVSVTAGTVPSTRTVTIEVVGAPLNLSPATAVAEQDITVSGSGFTPNTIIAPNANIDEITIGAFAVPAANIAGGAEVKTDNSGNMVATVRIPIDGNNPTTRTAGTYVLTVTDASGRTGQATLTIPSRTITVSPAESRRATEITVTGAGFPSRQTINVTYTDQDGTLSTLGSVTPDSVGGFTAKFQVPTNADIPSRSTVNATSQGNGNPNATFIHNVPGATVSVAQVSAAAGATITVSGQGFPGFSTMDKLDVGGLAALPSPAPSSGGDGSFSVTALVPQLALGTQAVLVRVGGISGTASISVVAAAVVPVVVVPTSVATATVFAAVIANTDNLTRVWRYSNETQSWSFFDPRAAFATANTLKEASAGNIVWVNVKVKQEFQGQTLYAGWNQIVLK